MKLRRIIYASIRFLRPAVSAFFLCLVFSPLHSVAQVNYAGKNFFFTMGGDMTPINGDVRLMLSSKHHANVSFHYTNTFWPAPPLNYTITPGVPVIVHYDFYLLYPASNFLLEQVDGKGVQIESDSAITVTALIMDGCADDGTEILPVDNQAIARKYFLLGLSKEEGNAPWGHYTYSMVATCDSVIVEIIPKASTYSRPANIPYTIHLDKGETYQISTSDTGAGDLSGTEINILQSPVNVPINLFCTYQPIYNAPDADPVCCADALYEQLLPVELWDTLVPVVPLYQSYLRLKILSSADNNKIYFDNVAAATLNKGDVIDTVIDIPEGMIIRGDHPIAVTEYMLSESWDAVGGQGDPDMHWSLPPWKGVTEAYFRLQGAPNSVGDTVGIVRLKIIARSRDTGTVKFDNLPVAEFHPFPADTSFWYASIKVDSTNYSQTHHLVSGGKVTAFLVKVYDQGGYSFNLSDLNMDSVAAFGNPGSIVLDSVFKCKGTEISIGVQEPPPYFWSTGESTSSIVVKDTGLYWVKLVAPRACDSQFILHQFFVVDTQSSRMIGTAVYDTIVKCPEMPVTLSAGNAIRYLWSTGDTLSSISVPETGDYWVKEFLTDDPCVATFEDHHFLVKDFALQFALGPDTTACQGDYVRISSGLPGTVWSTGDTAAVIYADKEGTYSAVFTDSCNQVHSDSVSISFQFCPDRFCNIEFPAAFTPNGDGKNDIFRAITYGELTGYELAIYNRWGQIVYHTFRLDQGWDGTFRGKPADLGVYVFLCHTNCPKKGTVMIKGDVTLVR